MIICDIDGTLFNNYHRVALVPANRTNTTNKDWSSYSAAHVDDLSIYPIINFVKHLAMNSQIIFITSRCESFRETTGKQLFEHFSDHECDLIMRKINDNSAPAEFKRHHFKRLLDESINNENIIIDDNPEVIKMAKTNFPQADHILVPSFDCTVNKAEPFCFRKIWPI